ncbi:MAG: hypothetical protein SWY16_01975 [Cyanobacteriota bacterium]|nr:hypothetical protein [Cyanobacteriota bacterium]
MYLGFTLPYLPHLPHLPHLPISPFKERCTRSPNIYRILRTLSGCGGRSAYIYINLFCRIDRTEESISMSGSMSGLPRLGFPEGIRDAIGSNPV